LLPIRLPRRAAPAADTPSRRRTFRYVRAARRDGDRNSADEAILVVDQCQEQPLLHQGAVAVAPPAVVGVGWVDYQRVAEAVTGRIGAAEGDGRRLQVW